MQIKAERAILLASQSPRRAQLLEEAGIHFSLISVEYEESFDPDTPPEGVAALIAESKAMQCRHLLTTPHQILLTADSVVIVGDEILGKPADEQRAFEMLKLLSGRVHRVITGVCLLSLDKQVLFDEVAEVEFYPLTEAEISKYITECNPLDKAGAYGIQDWLGLCKVKRINGNFSNIMGLPMSRLYHELNTF
ncbi:MAG TPA: Maf family protein [Saprospiraceae bacterium]|nr:Maf family protein [Saprospiraceae bacterium]